MSKVFLKVLKKQPAGAIFLSGSGTNAIKILDGFSDPDSPKYWIPKVIVTDRPKTSQAAAIAEKYGLPMIGHGIAAFYREHGLDKVTVSTPEGKRVRQLWTESLLEKLRPFDIDFGILAGFITLANFADAFPCLNVHPGDLTYRKNGCRYLTGLHTIPVELAILEGLDHLRSSVILVKPFTGKPQDIDSGHILGISERVPLDLKGHTLEELQKIFRSRTHGHIHGANHDILFDLANYNQERLKFAGDHAIYPEVINDFARNFFAEDDNGKLLYKGSPVETVEYHRDGSRIPIA